MSVILDSENVLTEVVAEAAVVEAVAKTCEDQDRGRLHHIVETLDLLRSGEGTPRLEAIHPVGKETFMFPEEEVREVDGRATDERGQSRDLHPAEAIEAMEEEQAEEDQVAEDQ